SRGRRRGDHGEREQGSEERAGHEATNRTPEKSGRGVGGPGGLGPFHTPRPSGCWKPAPHGPAAPSTHPKPKLENLHVRANTTCAGSVERSSSPTSAE